MDKTNKETTSEELRQNWHITEMQHTWKARRQQAKRHADDAIAKAKAKAEKEEKIRLINQKHEAEKLAIESFYDVQRFQIEEDLNTELLKVAVDQDEYMHRFRNYVASLPKDEQAAYDMHRE